MSAKSGTKELGWGWFVGKGFTPIRDDNGVIQKAQCNVCKKIRIKRNNESLSKHALSHENDALLNNEDHAVRSPEKAEDSDGQDNTSRSAPKKRSSSDRLRLEKTPAISTAKIDELLLKLMCSWGKKFDDARSIHLHKFVQALHPTYTVPSPKNLEESILPRAADLIVTENAKKRKSSSLWIQKLSVENKDILISSIIAGGQYIYVDFLVVSQLNADFVKICQESCKTASHLYKVKIYSIVHNINIHLEKIEYSQGCFAFVCNSFDIFLDDLRKKHKPFNTTYEKKYEVDKYYDTLNSFHALFQDNVTIDKATKLLLQFFLDQPNNIAEAIQEIVQKFFTPIHFAAMYVNPNYKSLVGPQEKIKGFKYISNIMKEFDDLQGIQQYISGGEEFLDLFEIPEGCDEIDVGEFWRIASLSYPDMARIGQNLLQIPAIPKSLNSCKLTSLSQHEYNELSPDSVILLLSTLFEEL